MISLILMETVCQPNPLEYIVFNLTDTPQVYRKTRKIDTLERSIGGYITASLYEDMMDIGASPQLVNELVDVFGWQIDFFKVQKGDQFKVIYEETIVEGEPVGLGKIIGAYFQHFGGSNIWADAPTVSRHQSIRIKHLLIFGFTF